MSSRFDDVDPAEWQSDPKLAWGKGYDDGYDDGHRDGYAAGLAAYDAQLAAAMKIALCGREDVTRSEAVELFFASFEARAYRAAERELHKLPERPRKARPW